jgi:DnaJ-class molecular chaperone
LSELAPLEINALARIVDELDYYQLLHLEPEATGAELKQAYHATSRAFHPDANLQAAPEVRADCIRISKRLTEAYCVLRDPRRRRAYDEHRKQGGAERMQLSEAKAAHARAETETRQGKTPQGRQFFSKANADLKKNDYASAVNNLQMALTFEPGNSLFEEKLSEARERRKSAQKA